MPSSPQRLPHVQAVSRDGRAWLYYRRGGKRWALPGPEGSAAFILAYERIHAAYGTLRTAGPRATAGTVEAAIVAYLSSGDYQQLSPRTQESYRRILDGFRTAFGPLFLASLDPG